MTPPTTNISTLAFFYLLAVGACVGSFLNVVIARLPEDLSVVHPRSRCPKCRNQLRWFENLPLISFVLLRGKCRRCKKPIALRYPLVEALTALLWGAVWLRWGWSPELALWLPLSAALLAITFLDLDHWWIPNRITYPALIYVALWAVLSGGTESLIFSMWGLLPACLLAGVAWGFERLTGREGMGWGDVKLLALIGLALGPLDTLTSLVWASFQGLVIGGLVVRSGGHRPLGEERDAQETRTRATGGPQEVAPLTPDATEEQGWQPPARAVPFGPFLVLGALEVALLPHIFADLLPRLSRMLLG